MPMQSDTFYEHGLRFSCTECSLCCRFDSGYVFLSEPDILRLAARVALPEPQFIAQYCRVIDLGPATRITLREQSNLDCVFWQAGGCSVYEDRPLQCRSFPFWSTHLESLDSWRALQRDCPGIDVGCRHSPQAIEAWLARRRSEPFHDPGRGRVR
ncbi:MAG: YkgJ family cysteine cluster protein [Spirochaetaceae bacterium]|nr:MAG: YkgJ family cysteine cluster protein [Spirochaetaceae bacterium]